MAQEDAKYHINIQLTYSSMVHQCHPRISEALHSSPFFNLYLLYT